jgi:hypothetical protein
VKRTAFATLSLSLLSMLLLSCTMGASRASAQEQPPAAPQRAPQPAPQPAPTSTSAADEESTPTRKWPPFGLALGVGVREIVPEDDSTSGYTTLTPVARFIRNGKRAGLVPAFRIGLGKQRTTLIESGGAAGDVEVGSVYVRPLTAGLGWSQPVAQRLSMVFSGMVGYSWNGFEGDDNGRGHPQLRLPSAVVDISNSFAWELSGRAWFDLNSRVSLMGGLSFLSTRPDLTLADGSTRAWNASQLRIEAGVAFTVLKPLRRRR